MDFASKQNSKVILFGNAFPKSIVFYGIKSKKVSFFFGFKEENAYFAADINIIGMIKRILETTIQQRLWQGKAIIIFGARQVGKTTMLKNLLQGRDDVLWLNGDEQDVRSLFENASSTMLHMIIGKKKIVVIDEAQRITNIGLGIKLITDNIRQELFLVLKDQARD